MLSTNGFKKMRPATFNTSKILSQPYLTTSVKAYSTILKNKDLWHSLDSKIAVLNGVPNSPIDGLNKLNLHLFSDLYQARFNQFFTSAVVTVSRSAMPDMISGQVLGGMSLKADFDMTNHLPSSLGFVPVVGFSPDGL